MRARERRGQAGMSLIELMVAMVILGIVIAAAFNVAYSMMNSYRDHRRAVAVERAARGAVTVLANAVRNASPGVGNGDILDAVGCTTTAAIQVVNSTDAPDQLRLVYGKGGVVTSNRTEYVNTETVLEIYDGSGFRAGDHVMIVDFANWPTSTKAHVMEVSAVGGSGSAWTLTLAQAPSACASPVSDLYTYPVHSTVVRVQLAEFSI